MLLRNKVCTALHLWKTKYWLDFGGVVRLPPGQTEETIIHIVALMVFRLFLLLLILVLEWLSIFYKICYTTYITFKKERNK